MVRAGILESQCLLREVNTQGKFGGRGYTVCHYPGKKPRRGEEARDGPGEMKECS